MEEKVILEKKDNVATLFLNNPAAYNSFDIGIISLFADHVVSLASDRSVHGLVISGKGKAFCSGGDLRWARRCEGGPAAALHGLSSRFHQAIAEIRRMKKPVVAAVNGIAAGGGLSLALACDFRVLAESAVLRQGFTSNGLSMDGSGTFTLPRLVGLARAMEIMAFDKPITAGEALRLGLATRVAGDDRALAEARDMIADILSRVSLSSYGWSKQLMTDSFHSSLETQMERERAGLSGCASHVDGIEGIDAFLEKRKPRFNR